MANIYIYIYIFTFIVLKSDYLLSSVKRSNGICLLEIAVFAHGFLGGAAANTRHHVEV